VQFKQSINVISFEFVHECLHGRRQSQLVGKLFHMTAADTANAFNVGYKTSNCKHAVNAAEVSYDSAAFLLLNYDHRVQRCNVGQWMTVASTTSQWVVQQGWTSSGTPADIELLRRYQTVCIADQLESYCSSLWIILVFSSFCLFYDGLISTLILFCFIHGFYW